MNASLVSVLTEFIVAVCSPTLIFVIGQPKESACQSIMRGNVATLSQMRNWDTSLKFRHPHPAEACKDGVVPHNPYPGHEALALTFDEHLARARVSCPSGIPRRV